MKFSLSQKIVGTISFLSFVFFAFVAYYDVSSYYSLFQQASIDRAKSIAYSLDANIRSHADLDPGTLYTSIQKHLWLFADATQISANVLQNGTLTTIASNETSNIGLIADIDNLRAYQTDTIISKTVTTNGIQSLVVITPIHASGLNVGTYQIQLSLDTVNNQLRSKLLSALLMFLCIFIAYVSILTLLMNNIVVKPLAAIHEGLHNIAEGNFDRNMQITSHDELEDVAHTFNTMSAELKESRDTLSKRAIDLEAAVNDRTKKLNQKISELEGLNKLMLERELKMAELQEQIDKLTKS